MAKYAYPAIFTPETEGGFSVRFPDLEGCYTCGDDMVDALGMAEDALALTLYGYEKDGYKTPLPRASFPSVPKGGFFYHLAAFTTKTIPASSVSRLPQ